MIHIYDEAAQLRKEIKYVNELHEKYFGKTERSAATNIGDVGPACNPERIGETMTEKLQPGLGSGALREALCEALDCINDNIDIPGTEWADRPMTQWMSDWRLSLSSPIEPAQGASDDKV